MAGLLVGLWKMSGLPVTGDDGAARPRPQRRQTRQAPAQKPKGKDVSLVSRGSEQRNIPNDLPPGLVGLLRQIPAAEAGWTKGTRDAFLAAFSAVLDFTVPVVDLWAGSDGGDEEADEP